MTGRAGQTLKYSADGKITATSGTSGSALNPNPNTAGQSPGTSASGDSSRFYTAAGNLIGIKDATGVTLALGITTAFAPVTGEASATRSYSFLGKTVAQRSAKGGVVQYAIVLGDGVGTAQTLVLPSTATAGVTTVARYTDPYGLIRGPTQQAVGTAALTAQPVQPAGSGTNAASQTGFGAAHGYLGKLADTQSSLTQVGARDYDPVLGVFTAPDPVFNATPVSGSSPYAYAGHDPINYSDPSGLTAVKCDMCGGKPIGEITGVGGGGAAGGASTVLRTLGPSFWDRIASIGRLLGSIASSLQNLGSSGSSGARAGGAGSRYTYYSGDGSVYADSRASLRFYRTSVGSSISYGGGSGAGFEDDYGAGYSPNYGDGGADWGYVPGSGQSSSAGYAAAAAAAAAAAERRAAGLAENARLKAASEAATAKLGKEGLAAQAASGSGSSGGAGNKPPGGTGFSTPDDDENDPDPAEGFSSFRSAKRSMGSPGDGNVYDHVVEQSQISDKRSGFDPRIIHNPRNLNPVPSAINQAKANYYSSVRGFTSNKTIRDWLSGQSFREQYNFSMRITDIIQNGGPLP
ncbi:RHS repeat-associated core domain-containing protein [Arthrobacter woluwensis]|uniref:RHS repeat-associated core domain-containing protein n=2 Tax=Arthrobacter woluwensis TaxID=156980 RepID=A0A1H4JKI9_9MICC|nr:RHS repeat-associated core domain-containing protein [Arthrobacter woluwensis]